MLELVQDGAGVAEEAEKYHRLVNLGRLGQLRLGIEVPQPHRLEARGEQPLDRMAEIDHVGRHDRRHSKRHDDDGEHVLVDLVQGHPQRRDHDRELAHLCQVDGGHDARPQPEPQRVEDRHDDDPADDHEDRGGQGQLEHLQARDGDLHAQCDEEKRDEEVAEADRLGDHIDVVGKRREADAGDQGTHLAREPDQAGRAGQEEAPPERGHEDELVFGEGEAPDHEHRATPQRAQERDQIGIQDVRLHGEHADRPQVLDHQHAERDAPGQGVELELVVQDLDHHERAGEAHAGREVEQGVVVLGVRHPDHGEETQPERDADRHLQRAGEQDREAAGGHLAEVDLEPDDKQQQDQ